MSSEVVHNRLEEGSVCNAQTAVVKSVYVVRCFKPANQGVSSYDLCIHYKGCYVKRMQRLTAADSFGWIEQLRNVSAK